MTRPTRRDLVVKINHYRTRAQMCSASASVLLVFGNSPRAARFFEVGAKYLKRASDATYQLAGGYYVD